MTVSLLKVVRGGKWLEIRLEARLMTFRRLPNTTMRSSTDGVAKRAELEAWLKIAVPSLNAWMEERSDLLGIVPLSMKKEGPYLHRSKRFLYRARKELAQEKHQTLVQQLETLLEELNPEP